MLMVKLKPLSNCERSRPTPLKYHRAAPDVLEIASRATLRLATPLPVPAMLEFPLTMEPELLYADRLVNGPVIVLRAVKLPLPCPVIATPKLSIVVIAAFAEPTTATAAAIPTIEEIKV